MVNMLIEFADLEQIFNQHVITVKEVYLDSYNVYQSIRFSIIIKCVSVGNYS